MTGAGRPDLAAAAGSLLTAGALTVAAVFALGQPDPSMVGNFLNARTPTHDDAVATVQFVVWAMVAGLVFFHVVSAIRSSGTVAEQVRRKRFRARLALTLGTLIFCGGALHHQPTVGPICCGDVQRADLLAR